MKTSAILSLILLMSVPYAVNESLINGATALFMFFTFALSFIVSIIATLEKTNSKNQ
jgi:hypothetical protein